jgi:uncharacterized protein
LVTDSKPARRGAAAVFLTVVCVGLAGLLAGACQSAKLYPGTELPRPDVDVAAAGIEVLTLQTTDGAAWYLPALAGERPAPVLFFFHGNYETIGTVPRRVQRLREAGVAVVAVEYPGYGGAPGDPSQESLTEVAVAAFDAVVARADVDPERVAVWGFSLGGGPACQLAAQRPVRALMVQGTFTSVTDMAAEFWVPGFLISDPFDNAAVIRDFPGRVLVLHGDRDEVIPYAHGQALGGLGAHVEFHRMRCGHNDCPRNRDAYWDRIETFLRDSGVLP